jgi:hypothetical protein
MKNLHILATDKPSRLILQTNNELRLSVFSFKGAIASGVTQNIYITNDEEIKKDDWCISIYKGLIKASENELKIKDYVNSFCSKIILTTDQDLIKDGVQAIDDEFLEWFIKNPSCEEVEILRCPIEGLYTIIPKEELEHKGKELTTEEVMESRSSAYEFIDFDEKDLREHPLKPNECFKQETLEEVELAILFHNTYERLAPSFGYETRVDTKLFDITTPNGKLMIAVCKEVIKWQHQNSYSEEDMKDAYVQGTLGLEYKKSFNESFYRWFEQFKKKQEWKSMKSKLTDS